MRHSEQYLAKGRDEVAAMPYVSRSGDKRCEI
jgi:hypothetical protein